MKTQRAFVVMYDFMNSLSTQGHESFTQPSLVRRVLTEFFAATYKVTQKFGMKLFPQSFDSDS